MNTGKTPIRLALLPLISLVGAACAIYLSRHYYDLRVGAGGFSSLCNINATMNCDAVASSRFAEIVPGLPLSSFVAGWYVALLITSLLARAGGWRREAIAAGTLMSGFAALYSLGLLGVMALIIRKYCAFCLAIDAVNFALFAIFFSLTSRAGLRDLQWKKLQSYAWIAAVSVLVMVVVLRPSTENEMAQVRSEMDYTVNQILSRTPIDIKIPANTPVLGNPNAPISILEFSDFQCPHCKRGAVLMNQLVARHADQVKIVYMPFPLDSACNKLMTSSMHPYSCELARVAYCSAKQGKFLAVYEKIFDDQEFLNAASAKDIPAANGVDAKALADCVSSEEAKAWVAASIDQGIQAKVEATPTFYLNGRKIEGVLPIEAWDTLISKATP